MKFWLKETEMPAKDPLTALIAWMDERRPDEPYEVCVTLRSGKSITGAFYLPQDGVVHVEFPGPVDRRHAFIGLDEIAAAELVEC